MQFTPRNDPSTLGAVTDHPSSQYPPQPPYGPPAYGPPAGYPQPPPKKGLSTGALVALIVGVFVVLVCGGAAIVAATSPDTTSNPRTSTRDTAATDGTTAGTTAAEATKAAATKTAKLGETIEFTGAFGSQVVNYTLAADKSYTKSPDGLFKPEKGTFYAVTATVQVVKGSAYASPYDFALIAADGSAYDPVLGFGFDNTLDSLQLNTGQKTAGLVVFDVPAAALKGAKIELRADFFSSGDAGYWQLP